MPGFIDAHRHLIQGNPAQWLKEPASARMQEFLDAGFTTVFSAGDSLQEILELRRRLQRSAHTRIGNHAPPGFITAWLTS